MKDILTPSYIANFVVNLFIFVLLAMVYMYIQKLEKAGNCDCAFKYPHVGFIKTFSVFALVFIVFVMFIPPGTVLAELFGKEVTAVYIFVIFVFYIVFAVYLYMCMSYTRLLITEKCKCSEDIRRELIFAGATIEMILLILFLLTTIIIPIVLSTLTIFFGNIKDVSSKVETNLKSPLTGIRSIPKDLSKLGKQSKNLLSKTKKGLKSLTKK